jgi:hypothetical protein
LCNEGKEGGDILDPERFWLSFYFFYFFDMAILASVF